MHITHVNTHIHTNRKHKSTKRSHKSKRKRFARSMYTYIIDLDELDVRYTKDLKFLHAYSEPSLLILHETRHTHTGLVLCSAVQCVLCVSALFHHVSCCLCFLVCVCVYVCVCCVCVYVCMCVCVCMYVSVRLYFLIIIILTLVFQWNSYVFGCVCFV